MQLTGFIKTALASSALLLAAVTGTPARAAVDWSKVEGKDIVLLYPGQTSWEWNLTEADHSAAGKFKAGKNCIACHKGEEKTQGDLMVSGKKAEPTPIPSFPGHVVTNIRFAYDDSDFLMRVQFREPPSPDSKMDPAFATRVAIIFNDAAVPEGVRAGCWASCHEDNASMPAAGGSDRTKYLMKTRAKLGRMGGGDALKPDDVLAGLKSSGYVQEWWQSRLNPGAKAQTAGGIIFDHREDLKSPLLTSEATLDKGVWTVTFRRPLNAPPPFLPLVAGKSYTFGIGVHVGHSAKRFHHTSYEYTMTLGGAEADFVAVKQ